MDWDYQIARVLTKMFIVFFLGMIYWSLMAYLGSRNPSKNLKAYPQLNFWGQAALIFAVMFGGLLFVDKKTKDLIKQNRIVAKALACFMVLSNIGVSIWQMYNNIHLLENGNLEELKILIRYRLGVLFGTDENVFDYYIHHPLWFSITTIGYAIYIFNFKRSDSKWFTKLRKAIGVLFLPGAFFVIPYFRVISHYGWGYDFYELDYYDILGKLIVILTLYLLLATYTWKKKKINDKTTITNDEFVKDEIVNEIITPNTENKMIDTVGQNKEETDINELIKPVEVVKIETEESQATENKPQTTPNEKPKKKKKKTWQKVLIGLGVIFALIVLGIGIYYYNDMKRSEESWEDAKETYAYHSKQKIINRRFYDCQLGDSINFKAELFRKNKYKSYQRGMNCSVYVFKNMAYGVHPFNYIALKAYKGVLIEIIMIREDRYNWSHFYNIFIELYNGKLCRSIMYYSNTSIIALINGYNDWLGHYSSCSGPHMFAENDENYLLQDCFTCIESIRWNHYNNDYFFYNGEKIARYYIDENNTERTNHKDLIKDLRRIGIDNSEGYIIRYFDIELCDKNIEEIEKQEFFIESYGL